MSDNETIQRLRDEITALRAENEALRAKVEVAESGYKAAVQTAQWQARTNGELNDLQRENARLRGAQCRLLNQWNEAGRPDEMRVSVMHNALSVIRELAGEPSSQKLAADALAAIDAAISAKGE